MWINQWSHSSVRTQQMWISDGIQDSCCLSEFWWWLVFSTWTWWRVVKGYNFVHFFLLKSVNYYLIVSFRWAPSSSKKKIPKSTNWLLRKWLLYGCKLISPNKSVQASVYVLWIQISWCHFYLVTSAMICWKYMYARKMKASWRRDCLCMSYGHMPSNGSIIIDSAWDRPTTLTVLCIRQALFTASRLVKTEIGKQLL